MQRTVINSLSESYYNHKPVPMTQSVMSLKNEDLEKAREIKAFLEKHFKVHHSYNDLVKKFGINKQKLKTTFKAVANCNIHEYITKLRMEKAKGLLENTNSTIGNIAEMVGLHKSNFIIQFKNYTGKTPTEWRNIRGLDGGPITKHTGT